MSSVEQLRSLEDVRIDASAPVNERMRSFCDQIGDPHHYMSHGTEVMVRFADGGPSINDALGHYLATKSNLRESGFYER